MQTSTNVQRILGPDGIINIHSNPKLRHPASWQKQQNEMEHFMDHDDCQLFGLV